MSSDDLTGRINVLTEQMIGAAIDVHRYLGPGLLESAYQRCLLREIDVTRRASGVRAAASGGIQGRDS